MTNIIQLLDKPPIVLTRNILHALYKGAWPTTESIESGLNDEIMDCVFNAFDQYCERYQGWIYVARSQERTGILKIGFTRQEVGRRVNYPGLKAGACEVKSQNKLG